MPAYIKVYYAFAVYLILCAVSSGLGLTYNIIWHHGGRGADGVFGLVAYAAIIITILKGTVSIQACRCYKQGTQLTDARRDIFIAAWLYIICFAIGMLGCCVLITVQYLDRTHSLHGLHRWQVLLSVGLLLLSVTGIYFSITDLMLLKAIRKKYEESTLSFETPGA